jgi:predicted membrane protein
MRENHNRPGLWPGVILVSVGAGLLARELGLLPAQVRVLDFWPLFVVLIGISLLLRARGVVSAFLALAFIATGGVLLAGNLGFLAFSATRLWPVLVVLLGLAVLFRGGRGPELREPDPRPPFASDGSPQDGSAFGEPELGQTTDEDRLIRQYTCAGAQLRIESQAWKGGKIGVTAGGVELDLRQARLDPEGAVLVLRVLMGGVEIRVPDTWQVQFDVTPLLGGADDSTRSTQGVSSAPRLRIIGNVTLGGVNVQN